MTRPFSWKRVTLAVHTTVRLLRTCDEIVEGTHLYVLAHSAPPGVVALAFAQVSNVMNQRSQQWLTIMFSFSQATVHKSLMNPENWVAPREKGVPSSKSEYPARWHSVGEIIVYLMSGVSFIFSQEIRNCTQSSRRGTIQSTFHTVRDTEERKKERRT